MSQQRISWNVKYPRSTNVSRLSLNTDRKSKRAHWLFRFVDEASRLIRGIQIKQRTQKFFWWGRRGGGGGREEGGREGERNERGGCPGGAGKLGLRVITTEVTILHQEQFVDGIGWDGRMQTLGEWWGVVRWWTMMGMQRTLMTPVTAAVVLPDVEPTVRPIQGQVAAAEALPWVSWIRVWKKEMRFCVMTPRKDWCNIG